MKWRDGTVNKRTCEVNTEDMKKCRYPCKIAEKHVASDAIHNTAQSKTIRRGIGRESYWLTVKEKETIKTFGNHF